MKTNKQTIQNQDTKVRGLGSESDRQSREQETDAGAERPRIDYAKRQANRQLPTKDLLTLLRTQAPSLYDLAEVVGKWVWIQFADKQPPTITSQLAEFGFHWNNKRQVWQHPCGPVTVDASPDDPRAKYGAFHPADAQPA